MRRWLATKHGRAFVSGTIGAGVATTLVLFIDAGAGDDTVTLAATANIQGRATVLLGSGADSLTRTAGAILLGIFLEDGGAGIDSFFGNPAGITFLNFP